jgi:hypothetical protein
VRTHRVVVAPLGLNFINVRRVTFAVPSETEVSRKNGGSLTTTDLSAAHAGDRARITTITFTPNWKTQRATAGSVSAAKILLID